MQLSQQMLDATEQQSKKLKIIYQKYSKTQCLLELLSNLLFSFFFLIKLNR